MPRSDAETIARHYYTHMALNGPEGEYVDWEAVPTRVREDMTKIFQQLLANQVIVPGPKR